MACHPSQKRKMMMEVEETAPPLDRCVAAYRAECVHSELEMRLGTWSNDGSFSPGVSREVFEQLERDLLDSPGLTIADPHYLEVVDFHYITGRDERARTRVEFDATNMELKREHTRKRAHTDVVLKRCEEAGGGAEACRVAFSRELPLESPPTACIPTHVRVKQRRRFFDVRDNCIVWSYELSKTWSANSRTAVEHLQHHAEPTYEVECELVDEGGAYLGTRTDAQVAASIALKARLLLGDSRDLETVIRKGRVPAVAAATASVRTTASRKRSRCRGGQN